MRKPKLVFIALVAVFGLIQLVPYGFDHDNPPTVEGPDWDTPTTLALVKRSCFDCHSNETVWPWYSNVAPLRWVIAHHVEEGREHLNFSRWDLPQKDAHEAAEEVEDGEMPMAGYLLLHQDKKLSESERAALIKGLKATIGDKK